MIPASKRLSDDRYQHIIWYYGTVKPEQIVNYVKKHYEFMRKRVVVKRGRKVPHGTKGTVFWMGESFYGYNQVISVGIQADNGRIYFTNVSNVEKEEEQ